MVTRCLGLVREETDMSKGPYPFKQSDVTRLYRGADKAGRNVIIEYDVVRRCLRAIPCAADTSTTPDPNEWDGDAEVA
jgi:hypothetical protein